MTENAATFWVFGYGSLMWDPGFEHVGRQPATLHGYHRSFCIYSHMYRGTPEVPGLVLGLDRGGCCRGIAYEVEEARREPVMDYLHEREMNHYVYLPRVVPVRLGDGRRIRAHTYVADRDTERFACDLSIAETAALIVQGVGQRGRNTDYLESTVRHLAEIGLPDRHLEKVLEEVRRQLGAEA